ncbi:MAG: DUF6291 domain-containing protein [Bacteroidia bacterium]
MQENTNTNDGNNTETIVFMKSYYTSIKRLKDPIQRDELLMAVLDYCFTGTEPELKSDVALMAWDLMKPTIDNSKKRYAASIHNGKKGGRPSTKVAAVDSASLKELKDHANKLMVEKGSEFISDTLSLIDKCLLTTTDQITSHVNNN